MNNSNSKLLTFLATSDVVENHRPWPRFRLKKDTWLALIDALQHNDWIILGLWAEPEEVHVALYENDTSTIAIASLSCPLGSFPTLSHVRPSAIRLERTVQDLIGLVAEGLVDGRPWLNHGQFPIHHPLASKPQIAKPRPATEYAFLTASGEGLHQIPVGPVHAGIIEPGHFRFHANGETVVRLEERLGYVHKGVERLMQGKTISEAAKIAGRISGDSMVAHALAFSRAVESALDVSVPVRAHALRALMSELERIANHFGDVGAICNDASFVYMNSQCGILREKVLQAAHTCFGHRLMGDCVIPGGVAKDLEHDAFALLHDLVANLRRDFEMLTELYDNTPTLLDRTISTGIVKHDLVRSFAPGGYIGRASGRNFDARKSPSYPPYNDLKFEVPVLKEGDVAARLWVRVMEVQQSLNLIEQIIDTLPKGPLSVVLPTKAGEGMALVEGFRGDILTWVRIGTDGSILRCHPRDPSWFQWPLLEVAIEGNIVADFPLCNKSFNCSYSGQDL